MFRCRWLVLPVGFGLLALGTAQGAWPVAPSDNVAISTGFGAQALPKLAVTPQGGAYIGFHNNASGNYDLFLQLLDENGTAMWATGGIAVSTQPQPSSLVDWAMIATSNGDAVIVYTDSRNGNDRDVYAYRVSPAGESLWNGADGVPLAVDDTSDAQPVLAELTDGSVVFVWPFMPSSGDGALMTDRLGPDGISMYGTPRVIATGLNETPSFAQIVSAPGDAFIVSWARNTRQFASPRHVRGQKFDANANPLWNAGVPLEISNGESVPIAYLPQLRSDEAGGAVFAWHRSAGNRFDSFVQRVASDGTMLFPAGGVAVSTDLSQQHFDPAIAYDSDSGDTYVLWDPRNGAQNQWGIRAQKITAAGTRAWTDFGVEVEPLNTVNKSFPRAALTTSGFIGIYARDTGPVTNELFAVRLRPDGSFAWSPAVQTMANAPSDKFRLPVAAGPNGSVIAAWEDTRNSGDIYAQNINAGGALGVLADMNCDGIVSVADIGAFVIALTDPSEYATQFPLCDIRLADVNGDAVVTVADIGLFVQILTN